MDLIPGSRRSPGEGNGNLLQYSCLGNLIDRGAWRATVHGIAKGLDTTCQLNKSNNKSHLLYLCRHTVSLWDCSIAPEHLWSLFILIDSWERREARNEQWQTLHWIPWTVLSIFHVLPPSFLHSNPPPPDYMKWSLFLQSWRLSLSVSRQ